MVGVGILFAVAASLAFWAISSLRAKTKAGTRTDADYVRVVGLVLLTVVFGLLFVASAAFWQFERLERRGGKETFAAFDAQAPGLIREMVEAHDAYQAAHAARIGLDALEADGRGFKHTNGRRVGDDERRLMEYIYSAWKREVDALEAAEAARDRLRDVQDPDGRSVRDLLDPEQVRMAAAIGDGINGFRVLTQEETRRQREAQTAWLRRSSAASSSPAPSVPRSAPRTGNWWLDGMQDRYDRRTAPRRSGRGRPSFGSSAAWERLAEQWLDELAALYQDRTGQRLPSAADNGSLDPADILD